MIIRSYPNFADEQPHQKADLTKWIETLKNIHIKANLGQSKLKATDELIKDWERMEQRNFKDWMRYYESGDANKYKMAQDLTKTAQMSYYVNDSAGYFLPIKQDPPKPDANSINDQILGAPQAAQTLVQHTPERLPEQDKQKMADDIRRKLMGRLNAAEKLITSQQGRMFAGTDFERLLKSIYDLKRDIQLLSHKTSLSSEIYTDLIIRQANILAHEGSEFGSQFMMKFAQNNPGGYGVQLGDTPAGGSAPQGLGSLQNNDPTADMLTATPPGKEDDKEAEPTDGIDGFLANMEGAGVTLFDDKNEIEDELMVDDGDELADCDIDMGEADDLTVEAQMMPPLDKPNTPEPRKPRFEEKPKKVNEDPLTPDLTMPDQDKVGKTGKDVDAIIDTAFSSITVQDVIDKLENVANIFRNREISRQLSIVDMMMDRLQIGSYFSELNEMQNKSLDLNSYCLTRADSILSRLRGAMGGDTELDLQGKDPVPTQSQGLVNSLQRADKEDKQRKQMKRQVEDQKLLNDTKPVPEVEGIPQDLGNSPTDIEQPVKQQPSQQAV